MAPPPYFELGKLARDLFRKGYHPGLWQLNCKTMTNSGIEFLSSGFASQDAGKVQGSLQSKYKIEDYGLELTERWNTENLLFGEIVQRDKLAEGLMLGLEATYQPQSGDKEGKFKIGYAQENFNFLADMNIDLNGPLINASLVLGYENFLGGVGLLIDSGGPELSSHKFALGWVNEETAAHIELKDAKAWYASLFHKFSESIDAGVEFIKSAAAPEPVEGEPAAEEAAEAAGEGEMIFGVGMIYHLEESALIRAKINTNVEIGLGYEQKLREGITFSVSTVIEGKNLNDGNHRFGVGFALEC